MSTLMVPGQSARSVRRGSVAWANPKLGPIRIATLNRRRNRGRVAAGCHGAAGIRGGGVARMSRGMLSLLAASASLTFPLEAAMSADRTSEPGKEARLSVGRFAECIVRKEGAASATLVLSDPGTPAEDAAVATLAKSIKACDRAVRNMGLFPGRTLFRGAVAERLWLKHVLAFGPGGTAKEYQPGAPEFAAGFDLAGDMKDNYRTYFCVVYSDPDGVDKLIRTSPTSASEEAAFNVLSGLTTRCMQRALPATFDRSIVRALLAEQLYRLYPPQTVRTRSELLLKQKN